MKKQIISLSLAAAVAVSFSGCFGGGSLTTPVKKRSQDVDASVMLDVKGKASKSFDDGLKNEKYTNKEKVTLGELKEKNEKLYNLIKDRLIKKILYYKPENIIWIGIEYKPNAYTTQNSKNYEIYEKIKRETLKANLKINKMKLLTKENLEKIINENQLDIFENKKIIILVNHDETEIIREKFKENIIFDIKNLGTEIVLNDKLI